MRDLFDLTGDTNLQVYARHIFGTARPKRIELFKLTAFTEQFYALPVSAQNKLWAQLANDVNGYPIDFVHSFDLGLMFERLCRHPSAFDYVLEARNPKHPCPPIWLRRELALRFIRVATDMGMPAAIRSYTTTTPYNNRKRILYGQLPNPEWMNIMRRSLIEGLDIFDYHEWIEDRELTYLMIHEINAMKVKHIDTVLVKMIHHPVSLGKYLATRSPQSQPYDRSTMAY